MNRARAAVRTLGQGARSAAAVEPLLVAVRLLGGDAEALAALSTSLQLPWHDILAATLLYIDPTAQSYEIAYAGTETQLVIADATLTSGCT